MEFLDVDSESQRLVLSLLPPKDLVNLAGTCRYFYRAVYEGCFAEQLWKSLCIELLSPGIVALHEAAVPVGYKTAAIFWHDLWVAATNLNSVQWWQHGAQELKNNVAKVVELEKKLWRADAEEKAAQLALRSGDGLGEERRSIALAEAESGVTTLKSKLARSGHTSNLIGTRVVVTGGILRDGSKLVDIVVVDLATLTVSRPEASGNVPSTRFRHTTIPIKPSQGTPLEDEASYAIGPSKKLPDGELLFCFGGYNTIGEEFGADSIFVLWAAYDGSSYVWVQVKTQGHAPSPRFHHSCDSFADGKKVIVFGGEGYAQDDSGEGPSPCVYILDVDTLTWQRCITHAPLEEHSPGLRTLHVTTVRKAPATGREELVVVGGYSESLLADMKPFTLDLETLCWRCWPGLAPADRDMGLQLPAPRQRMAANRITKDWLLISGGCPASGHFLDDLQRLHIPTLTWGAPPDVLGQPSRALRKISGHTFSGLLAFGGCIPTIMGIMPVEKVDLLLLGQSSRGLVPVHDAPMQTLDVAHSSVAGEGGFSMQESLLGTKTAWALEGLQRLPRGKRLKQKADGALVVEDTEEQSDGEEVFDELMQDQLLSKGQRINIGSPDTYFRPVYATAAGVKTVQQEQQEAPRVQTRLQVISTSVLNDPEHIARMSRQLRQEDQSSKMPGPAAVIKIDQKTAAAAIAGALAAMANSRQSVPAEQASTIRTEMAAAGSSSAEPLPPGGPEGGRTPADNNMNSRSAVRFQDVVGPNPFQVLADASTTPGLKRPRTSDPLGPSAYQAARAPPLQRDKLAAASPAASEQHKRAAAQAEAAVQTQRRPTAAEVYKAGKLPQLYQPGRAAEHAGSSQPLRSSQRARFAHDVPDAPAAPACTFGNPVTMGDTALSEAQDGHQELGEGCTGSSFGPVRGHGSGHANIVAPPPRDGPHVTVVRNSACPSGPNPFAGAAASVDGAWTSFGSGTLLPLDAEFDPAAAELLRCGGPVPLEV